MTTTNEPIGVTAVFVFDGAVCEQMHVHENRTVARAIALTAERVTKWYENSKIVGLIVGDNAEMINALEEEALRILATEQQERTTTK